MLHIIAEMTLNDMSYWPKTSVQMNKFLCLITCVKMTWHAYIPNVPVKFLIMVPSIAIAFDLSYMYHFPSCNHAHSHNFRSPLIAKCNTICLTPTQGALLSAERCIARKCVDKVLELHSQFCYFCLVVWRGVSPNKMLCPMKGWEVIMHFSFLWLHVRLSCHMHLCVCVCMWM